MKKILITSFLTIFSCIFLLFLLLFSKECITLASNGLLIWYRNMIPSLFPFMVLSGFMIRSGLSEKIGQWLQPALGILFRLPSPMLYAIFMGFLCGFPMGAKMVADMLENEQITKEEGKYLLAFCNNIGPLYLFGYVIPLFGYENICKILALMYLIPLAYGLVLRYFSSSIFCTQINKKQTSFCHFSTLKVNLKKNNFPTVSICSHNTKNNTKSPNYLICFQQSLSSAIEQITMLGGCMIFFNCVLIFPQILGKALSHTSFSSVSPLLTAILSSFIEIGGGLQQLASVLALTDPHGKILHLTSFFTLSNPNKIYTYLPLALLTFGGLSCIAQTCFTLKNTGLKISTYIKHKLIQACIFILLIFIL